MRKLLFLFLLWPSFVLAQTTVNLSVTDTPDNQTWNSGTYTVNIVPAAGSSTPPGGPFNIISGGGSTALQSGSLSTTGTASIILPANVNIAPGQTAWKFTVCPQATAICFVQLVTVVVSSPQTVALTPPSIRINISTTAPPASAYADGEILGVAIGAQYYNLVSAGTRVCQAVSGNICTTWIQNGTGVSAGGSNAFTGPNSFSGATTFTGGGSLQGTWTGGPTATIAASPSGATELGNIATITTLAVCPFVTGQAVQISGVGVAGYNNVGNNHNAWIVLSPGCNGGTSFTYFNPVSGLAASGGGTALGSPILSQNVSIPSLLTTGTGARTQNVAAINLANYCGTSASPVALLSTAPTQQGFPCSYSSMWAAAPLGKPTQTNWSVVHRNDCVTATGVDTYGCIGSFSTVGCPSTNSGGYSNNGLNAGSVNCIADYGVATDSGGSGAVGASMIGQSTFAGPGFNLVQAQQNLSSTARGPGWIRDYFNDYSPMNTFVILAGSQSITSYLGMGSSQSGKGALIGEYVADSINAGHAVVHGAAIPRPDTAYLAGAAITAAFRSSCAPLYSWNLTVYSQYGSDCPSFGFLGEEQAVTSGASQAIGLVSSAAAGVTCTLLASPNGASELGFVDTFTCNAPCSFITGQPVTISSMTLANYNQTATVLSPGCNGGSSFTVNTTSTAAGPGAFVFTITNISEAVNTATVTTSATCNFVANQWVNIQNVTIAAPTVNNGFNGFFQVVSPCAGGSTFTYTLTGISGLATQTNGTAESYLPPSGGGSVTGASKQLWKMQEDSSANFTLGYCAVTTVFPCTVTNKVQFAANSSVHQNAADATYDFILRAGATADQVVSLDFQKFGGGNAWQLQKLGTNALALVDPGVVNRMLFTTAAPTQIRAGNGGTGDVQINDVAAAGTGGLSVFNGANGPTKTAFISGAGQVNGTTFGTATNCAVNSVSPAACGAAAAGAFVVPTTTTTYVVNTTAVTAASRIFLFPMSFAGNLPSSPTCVAPAVTSAPTISAISAATSFTLALPSTTGQTCWQYWIVD